MTIEASIVNRARELKGEISFWEEDLRDVVQPHNDVLVLTLQLQEYDVRRVLVDSGSSLEITYAVLFDKLGLRQSNLKRTSVPLFGFSGQAMHLKGMVTV